MAAGTENRIDTSNREIVITRTFDAPRALVCEAFLDAEHIGEWWGPTGFRITTRQFDARPGGRWTFVMHGPDGTDYDNTIEFRRLEPPALLVFAHINPDGSDLFETTVTFVETGGRTELTFRGYFRRKRFSMPSFATTAQTRERSSIWPGWRPTSSACEATPPASMTLSINAPSTSRSHECSRRFATQRKSRCGGDRRDSETPFTSTL